jgi:hypothetical protein
MSGCEERNISLEFMILNSNLRGVVMLVKQWFVRSFMIFAMVLVTNSFASFANAQDTPQNAAPQGAVPAGGAPQAGRGRGGRGGSPSLPTQAQWDSSVTGQAYVAQAKAIAGDDLDLQFDFGIFCKASGGATNEDRATVGVPNSLPHLTPYPSRARRCRSELNSFLTIFIGSGIAEWARG